MLGGNKRNSTGSQTMLIGIVVGVIVGVIVIVVIIIIIALLCGKRFAEVISLYSTLALTLVCG